jgi:RNA-directed DNA polymerase
MKSARTRGQQRTRRAQDRASVSQALDRIRQAARRRRKERFTALFHHISPEMLRTAFLALKREAAPGVDGLTWRAYAADLDHRIEDLHARVRRGAYRALPSRRWYIPKADGNQRPLAVAALEDKIVQRATAALLNAIYEEDFLGLSYGFRPGRCTMDAIEALHRTLSKPGSSQWVLDADIALLGDGIIMPRGSCGWAEQVGLLVYDSDAQAFSLAAANVNRRELAALDTLQHGLA